MHCLGCFGFPKDRSHLQTERSLVSACPKRGGAKKNKRKKAKQKPNNNHNSFFSALWFIGACVIFLWWFVDFALTDICYLLNQGLLRQQ